VAVELREAGPFARSQETSGERASCSQAVCRVTAVTTRFPWGKWQQEMAAGQPWCGVARDFSSLFEYSHVLRGKPFQMSGLGHQGAMSLAHVDHVTCHMAASLRYSCPTSSSPPLCTPSLQPSPYAGGSKHLSEEDQCKKRNPIPTPPKKVVIIILLAFFFLLRLGFELRPCACCASVLPPALAVLHLCVKYLLHTGHSANPMISSAHMSL
jgi:hypothetical protein